MWVGLLFLGLGQLIWSNTKFKTYIRINPLSIQLHFTQGDKMIRIIRLRESCKSNWLSLYAYLSKNRHASKRERQQENC